MISTKQREAIEFVVALNTTLVAIERTEYTASGGGRQKQTSSLEPQPMLLYPLRVSQREKGGLDAAAPLALEAAWGGLAPYTADVRWGTNVTDRFTVEGLGTFEIVSGRVLGIGADVNGYELKLRTLS